MSKRHLIRFSSALLLVAFTVVVSCQRATPAPHLLLVTIDTLRADHLGIYGYRRPTSPRLDALAREGIVFESAYCPLPSTVPSHASILFGTWPRIHGSTSNASVITNRQLSYLPELLAESGYTAAAFLSAEHLGKALEPFAGFDKLDYPVSTRSANRTLRLATRWWRSNAARKRFLWIHLWDPHSPYRLHPEHMPSINPDFNDDFERAYEFLPPGFSYTADERRRMVDLYDNEIAFVDRHLGSALDQLRRTSELDDTLLVITSDHGETLDELITSRAYAFDHSEFLVEPQIRVPLFFLLPDDSKSRPRRVSRLTSLLDLFPTILEFAGLPVPPTSHGTSLAPLLWNRVVAQRTPMVFLQRRTFVSPPRDYLAGPQFGIRHADFKLLYEPEKGRKQLFRAGNDDLDLIEQEPETARALENHLRAWLQATEGATSRAVEPEQLELLRSLGYVQ